MYIAPDLGEVGMLKMFIDLKQVMATLVGPVSLL